MSSTDGVGHPPRRVLAAVKSASRSTVKVDKAAKPAPANSSAKAKPTAATTPAPKKSAPTKASASKQTVNKKAAPAKASPAKAAQAKAAAPKRAPAKDMSAKDAPAKASTAQKSAAPKSAAPKNTAPKSAATKTAAAKNTATTKKTAPATTVAAPPEHVAPAKASPSALKVRENESPWTAAELAEVRTELVRDVERLSTEISTAETGLHELLRDSGDGAGDDQADAGAKTFEREQEITLANNSREMLEQSLKAVAAIDDATYGVCESCGLPVGKMRLQAFPRATLCVSCKSRQERR